MTSGLTPRNILLVEDNPDDEELTIRALQRSGLMNEIVVARDGVEALDYLFGTGQYAGRNTQIQPAVVLLDLQLPRINGIEVLQRLRADDRTRFLPVVVFTSSNEQRDFVDSYSYGCNSYICKPIDFIQFSAAVRQLGMYWLLLNEVPR
ncbi:response regulator [Pantanalinema sp. GBBB05]|uniref:response regulator n=1 Tax=Pantanalinema sp. GBBB05 TaxID=2604139 RepID=UPI001D1E31EC|nr:response regulator [Pantanalinema sp. GBBB05]